MAYEKKLPYRVYHVEIRGRSYIKALELYAKQTGQSVHSICKSAIKARAKNIVQRLLDELDNKESGD